MVPPVPASRRPPRARPAIIVAAERLFGAYQMNETVVSNDRQLFAGPRDQIEYSSTQLRLL